MKKIALILIAAMLLGLLPGCHKSAAGARPADLPQMDKERMKMIENAWHQEELFGRKDSQVFCTKNGSGDGIRYYGSYSYTDWDGTEIVCDILYIPCQELNIPSQVTLRGHTFRSRTGFGLYVYEHKVLDSVNVVLDTFYPLESYANSESYTHISDEFLASVKEQHAKYETWLYGSELVALPDIASADKMLSLKSAWLLNMGYIPSFTQEWGERYYGSFGSYEIALVPGQAAWVETKRIGGEEFTFSSSFTLYAYNDWKFYSLEEVYAAGYISREELAELAEIHRQWKSGG